MQFTHASLFSGIGGPEVAAAWMGWNNLFHCEINPFGRKVLEYWFPKSESYEDITKTNFTKWRGQVDVLTGGFPCQPFSYAGKRGGASDDRYLWPEMLRVIDEVRPAWVVGENVAGITTMVEPGEVSSLGDQTALFGEGDTYEESRGRFTIERVCADLEGLGYTVQPLLIPACAVGAPHKRDRVFIIGHIADTDCAGLEEWQQRGGRKNTTETRTGMDDRVERFGDNDVAADTAHLFVDGREPRHESDDGSSEESELGGDNRTWTERWTAPDTEGQQSERYGLEQRGDSATQQWKLGGSRGEDGVGRFYTNSDSTLLQCRNGKGASDSESGLRVEPLDSPAGLGRWDTFPTFSPVHRGNDGLPFDVARLAIPFGKWRTEALKACGNAIVPQVMYEIFRAIEIAETNS